MSESQFSSLKLVQPLEEDSKNITANDDNPDGGAKNKLIEMISSKEMIRTVIIDTY